MSIYIKSKSSFYEEWRGEDNVNCKQVMENDGYKITDSKNAIAQDMCADIMKYLPSITLSMVIKAMESENETKLEPPVNIGLSYPVNIYIGGKNSYYKGYRMHGKEVVYEVTHIPDEKVCYMVAGHVTRYECSYDCFLNKEPFGTLEEAEVYVRKQELNKNNFIKQADGSQMDEKLKIFVENMDEVRELLRIEADPNIITRSFWK